MRKGLLILLLLLGSTATIQSQSFNLILNGTVTDSSTGSFVAGQRIIIQFDSVSNSAFGYNSVQFTTTNGGYADTIAIPSNVTQGAFNIYAYNCGNALMQRVLFTQSSGTITTNFVVCNSNVQNTCNAGFSWSTAGDTVYFNNSSFASLGNITGYSWDFGDGSTLTGAPNPIKDYNTTGVNTYQVCLTITTAAGCLSTFCDSVTINSNINNINCQSFFNYSAVDSTADFFDTTITTGAVATWFWDFGDGNTSTQSSPSHTYSTGGTYIVCLTTTTTDSCTSVYCDSVIINYNGRPVCNAEYNFTIGQNLNVTFQDASTASDSITGWLWDFGNGTTSTLPNPGVTYSQAGLYSVCLTITTNNSCSNTICKWLNITSSGGGGQAFVVQGSVTKGFNITQDAVVYLIEYDAQAGTLTALDTTLVDTGGAFRFVAPGGQYLFKAALLPSDPDYANYLPTYLDTALTWPLASTINLTTNNSYFDITLIPGNNPGGPGFIGGLITQGANKVAGPGDPLEGIQVMVLDMNSNPVAYTMTDINGEYRINNLAYGTYEVWVEIPGKTTVPQMVTLDAQNPGFTNSNFVVNTNDILTARWETQEAIIEKISLAPNPAGDRTTLLVEQSQSQPIEISIRTLTGRTVYSRTHTQEAGKQEHPLDLTELRPGLYLLQVNTSTRQYQTKLMKQ